MTPGPGTVAPAAAWEASSPAAAGWVMPEHVRQVLAHLLVLTVGAWTVLPSLVQTLTAPKYRGRLGELELPASRLADLTDLALSAGLLGLCLATILLASRGRRPGGLLALGLFLAPWGYLVVRDAFARDLPSGHAVVYPLLVTALWLLRPSLSVLRSVGAVVATVAAVGIALGFLWPARGVFYYVTGELVSEGKATLPWGILVGHLTHGNKLGGLLALGLPFLFLLPRRWLRTVLVVLTAFALYWTASRGSMAAVAVAAVAVALLAVASPRLRPALASVGALAVATVVSVVPFVVDDPAVFSNRGLIWMESAWWWRESPFFGLGSGWYAAVGGTSDRIAATAFHAHNQAMHLAVTGGVVLLVLVGALLGLVVVRAARFAARTTLVPLGYVVALFVVMALERPLGIVDNASYFLVVLVPLVVIAVAEVPDRAR